MRRSLMAVPVLALAVAGSMATAEYAAGASKAPTTVTIKAQGTDLSGTVSSPKPKRCAKNRTVLLFKQKGARGGGDDQKVGSDTAELSGGKYEWSTGTTGIEGRFYATVKATPSCKGASSKTVRATR